MNDDVYSLKNSFGHLCEPMRLLVMIQSFIPESKYLEYLPVLRSTIESVRSQSLPAGTDLTVVLCDDGSQYLAEYAAEKIAILPRPQTAKIREVHGLDVDEVVLVAASQYFMKAELFNFYLRPNADHYDCLFFLDDDNGFQDNECLARVIAHFQSGYNYVIGRLCNPNLYFRNYDAGSVQGTTYAVDPTLLKKVGYFGEHVKNWGTGDDPELVWKLFVRARLGEVKAIYDGNIKTFDRLSGRWQYARKKAGGDQVFRSGFYELHGVDPYNNPSRIKSEWIELAKDDHGIPERLYPYIKLSEYLSFDIHPRYYRLLCESRYQFSRVHICFSRNVYLPLHGVWRGMRAMGRDAR